MTEHLRKSRLNMTLEDRLSQEEGWIYMTGMQALVRLPIQQRKRDQAVGLNTGGYISGYRGSPVGTYDMSLQQSKKELQALNIYFQPGLNEDLAATATWGAQMVGQYAGATVDGVFSIWYGKAPGMDRSMDPLRHANLAGTNPKGGTLLLVGDDHGAKSSTVACYSDLNFASLGMPLLAPSNVQDVLDFGLHGISMSRYSSVIVGMKLVTDVIEGGGSVYVGPDSPAIAIPEDSGPDVSIKTFTPFVEQERQLWDIKLKKALRYARANRLNRQDGPAEARIGIVAAGKAWQDLSQSLAGLGYHDGKIGNMPVRRLKVGMVWPLDEEIINEFAKGLDTILIVEEKRPLLEDQIRSILYGTGLTPRIVGKTFHGFVYSESNSERAFPGVGEIDPNVISRILVRVANEVDPACGLSIASCAVHSAAPGGGALRQPAFCAGCPHGRSTQVIDGSRALAGIGCHTMSVLRNPTKTNSISHMGGEGVMWLGQFPFTKEQHVFANMGDGTYFHSGILAIRAAIAAKAPITYKLLHNGFVSMTGGQAHDGEVNPEQMVRQVRSEGVKRIALVSDEPEKYAGKNWGEGVTLHPREEMELVQKELRTLPGVTVIIYDQACATERRRLRKRGNWADPDKRVFINPEVCEGCGDCSTVSSCMAIEPLETPLGRKRQINQSSCNKDFSCVEGFCPSFVTVSGASLRKVKAAELAIDISHLPEPRLQEIDGSWAILIAGIGGAGVVTVGQTLAVAAHADGYFASNLDITGLAQKYGAVYSHIKVAISPEQMRSTRIATGESNALIGCDLVVAVGDEALSKLTKGKSVAVTDTTVVPTFEFSQNPDWQVSGDKQLERIIGVLGDGARGIDAQGLSEKIMGDRVFANMLLMGAAWQQGGIPLSLKAIHRAIELNGVSIDKNKQAFNLGRLAYADAAAVQRMAKIDATALLEANREKTVAEIVAHRVSELTDYKDATFAERYSKIVARLQGAGLSIEAVKAVAQGLYKLLAVKDEWEVARLYSKPSFRKSLAETFDGDLELTFYFGAWPFGGKNEKTGKMVKGALSGGKAMMFFGLMNCLRFLRGTAFDPFRNTSEARLARKLQADYEADIEFALSNWSPAKAEQIIELLALPEKIRGYGHVRERNALEVANKRETLRTAIQSDMKSRAA
jgi:indolepyruvate ferredoxin oxidoreductase